MPKFNEKNGQEIVNYSVDYEKTTIQDVIRQ